MLRSVLTHGLFSMTIDVTFAYAAALAVAEWVVNEERQLPAGGLVENLRRDYDRMRQLTESRKQPEGVPDENQGRN